MQSERWKKTPVATRWHPRGGAEVDRSPDDPTPRRPDVQRLVGLAQPRELRGVAAPVRVLRERQLPVGLNPPPKRPIFGRTWAFLVGFLWCPLALPAAKARYFRQALEVVCFAFRTYRLKGVSKEGFQQPFTNNFGA